MLHKRWVGDRVGGWGGGRNLPRRTVSKPGRLLPNKTKMNKQANKRNKVTGVEGVESEREKNGASLTHSRLLNAHTSGEKRVHLVPRRSIIYKNLACKLDT